MRSTVFCSDISNFVVYYSTMFKGMGVVFIFQNGMLNNNVSTIYQVAGVKG